MLRKLFPGGFSNSSFNSFKIVLVAEGCLANEAARFIGDCVDFIGALFNRAPFGLTLARPDWFGVHTAFATSSQSGPAIEAPVSADRTTFESAQGYRSVCFERLHLPPASSSLTQRQPGGGPPPEGPPDTLQNHSGTDSENRLTNYPFSLVSDSFRNWKILREDSSFSASC